jgi:FlaG/FlaF family flagellin (archaellin)
MKGVSPLISAIILITITFGILGAIIGPWMFTLTYNTTQQTTESTEQKIMCTNAGYDFDPNYGINGIYWNFLGTSDELKTRITNTGTINLYNFSFEFNINITTGLETKHFSPTPSTQKTSTNPLKPGQSTILDANITEDITGTLKEVKILNDVCPSIYIDQEV